MNSPPSTRQATCRAFCKSTKHAAVGAVLLALQATAQTPAATVPPPPTKASDVQKIDPIIVEGVIAPEDARKRDKAAIGRMRDSLDKVAPGRGLKVTDSVTNGGVRKAQLNANGNIFCVESKAGQIDFAGLGTGGTVTKPAGNSCP